MTKKQNDVVVIYKKKNIFPIWPDSSNLLAKSYITSAVILGLLALESCTTKGFEINDVEKGNLISDSKVFNQGRDRNSNGSGRGVNTDVQSGDKKNNTSNNGGMANGTITQTTIDVKYLCSNAITQANQGVNVKSSSSLRAEIYKQDDYNPNDFRKELSTRNEEKELTSTASVKPLCAIDEASIKNDILNTKSINLSGIVKKCLDKGVTIPENVSLVLDIVGSMGQHSLSLAKQGFSQTLIFKKVGANLIMSNTSQGDEDEKYGNIKNQDKGNRDKDSGNTANQTMTLLYDKNEKEEQNSESQTQKDICDLRASPLIVHLSKNKYSSVDLSAPTNGIKFDILGRRSSPAPHSKKQISWFTESSADDFYFITLPSRDGNVYGIDNLFGDNTFGPDGKFAENGYSALQKFEDAPYDQIISEKDKIFHRLRFWKDSNRNGKAEPSELFSAQELQIEHIDLRFDSKFQETDKYGNQVKMKSVVKTRDGKLHLMFDLWFRYL